jgi:hypothetical protein
MRNPSRGACAPEFCQDHSQRNPSEHDPVRLGRRWHRLSSRSCPINKREAERRQAHQSILRALRARLALKRSALACRRSTTALAAATERHSSAPERASWDVAQNGRYPSLPVPVQRAPRRPVIMPAGRMTRSRPGAEVTSPRPREPLSLRQPVSPADVPDVSEIADRN